MQLSSKKVKTYTVIFMQCCIQKFSKFLPANILFTHLLEFVQLQLGTHHSHMIFLLAQSSEELPSHSRFLPHSTLISTICVS